MEFWGTRVGLFWDPGDLGLADFEGVRTDGWDRWLGKCGDFPCGVARVGRSIVPNLGELGPSSFRYRLMVERDACF